MASFKIFFFVFDFLQFEYDMSRCSLLDIYSLWCSLSFLWFVMLWTECLYLPKIHMLKS